MKKVLIGITLSAVILVAVFYKHLQYSIGFSLFMDSCAETGCQLAVVPTEKVLSAPALVSSTTVEFSGIQLHVPVGGTVEQLELGGMTVRYGERRLLILNNLTLPDIPGGETLLFPRNAGTVSPYDYLTAIYAVTPDDFNHLSRLEKKQIVISRLLVKDVYLTTDQIYRVSTEKLRGYMFVGGLTNADIEVAGKGYAVTFIGFTDEERDAVLQSIEE